LIICFAPIDFGVLADSSATGKTVLEKRGRHAFPVSPRDASENGGTWHEEALKVK
jgi:hypothetical protein